MECPNCKGIGLVVVRHPIVVWEIMAAGLMDFEVCGRCEGTGLADPPEYHICNADQCCAACNRHATPHRKCIMR